MNRFDNRIRQELLDREMAPVIGRCRLCGGELYRRRETEEQGGLCPDCAIRPAKEEDGERIPRLRSE